MTHTLTLNPSLDYWMEAPSLAPGVPQRARTAELFAGGKGINVALMLRRLGRPARALGFLAGPTGRLLRELLAAEGLSEAMLPLDEGFTRINLKLETPAGETELNGPGPAPRPAALAALEEQLRAVPQGDTLVAAGSLPPGLPPDAYARLLAGPAARGVRCVLDASGAALRAGLAARPWLIKPNRAELAELVGGDPLRPGGRPTPAGKNVRAPAGNPEPQSARFPAGTANPAETAFDPAGAASGSAGEGVDPAALPGAMRAAQRLGARNVLVSLGGQGAALLGEDGRLLFQPAPAGRPVNTAGAGDSLLAGFLAGLDRTGDPAQALRLGVAAGSATAFCPWLADAEEVERLLAALPAPARGE